MAGQICTALFNGKLTKATGSTKEAFDYVVGTIRLAGLLHDLGHGPFSHLFESCLKHLNLKVGDLATELKIPAKWLTRDAKSAYYDARLKHEHFSFALTKILAKDCRFDAQDVCSMLSDDFRPSNTMAKHLGTIAKLFSKTVEPESLKQCLKQVLSGEIDADRLDYLRRDSHFCGIRIAGIDLDHILASISLAVNGSFYIQLKRNAVPAIEQVLVSRKQMFNQVYNHRINASYDEVLLGVLYELFDDKKLKPPKTYSDFMVLTDEYIDQILVNEGVNSKKFKNGNLTELRKAFYLTRTTLERVHEVTVPAHRKVVETKKLSLMFNTKKTARILHQIELKEFTKLTRWGGKGNNSAIRVPSEIPDCPAMPINQESEVINSSLWQTNSVKIVVFEGYKKSAANRKLKQKSGRLSNPSFQKNLLQLQKRARGLTNEIKAAVRVTEALLRDSVVNLVLDKAKESADSTDVHQFLKSIPPKAKGGILTVYISDSDRTQLADKWQKKESWVTREKLLKQYLKVA